MTFFQSTSNSSDERAWQASLQVLRTDISKTHDEMRECLVRFRADPSQSRKPHVQYLKKTFIQKVEQQRTQFVALQRQQSGCDHDSTVQSLAVMYDLALLENTAHTMQELADSAAEVGQTQLQGAVGRSASAQHCCRKSKRLANKLEKFTNHIQQQIDHCLAELRAPSLPLAQRIADAVRDYQKQLDEIELEARGCSNWSSAQTAEIERHRLDIRKRLMALETQLQVGVLNEQAMQAVKGLDEAVTGLKGLKPQYIGGPLLRAMKELEKAAEILKKIDRTSPVGALLAKTYETASQQWKKLYSQDPSDETKQLKAKLLDPMAAANIPLTGRESKKAQVIEVLSLQLAKIANIELYCQTDPNYASLRETAIRQFETLWRNLGPGRGAVLTDRWLAMAFQDYDHNASSVLRPMVQAYTALQHLNDSNAGYQLFKAIRSLKIAHRQTSPREGITQSLQDAEAAMNQVHANCSQSTAVKELKQQLASRLTPERIRDPKTIQTARELLVQELMEIERLDLARIKGKQQAPDPVLLTALENFEILCVHLGPLMKKVLQDAHLAEMVEVAMTEYRIERLVMSDVLAPIARLHTILDQSTITPDNVAYQVQQILDLQDEVNWQRIKDGSPLSEARRVALQRCTAILQHPDTAQMLKFTPEEQRMYANLAGPAPPKNLSTKERALVRQLVSKYLVKMRTKDATCTVDGFHTLLDHLGSIGQKEIRLDGDAEFNQLLDWYVKNDPHIQAHMTRTESLRKLRLAGQSGGQATEAESALAALKTAVQKHDSRSVRPVDLESFTKTEAQALEMIIKSRLPIPMPREPWPELRNTQSALLKCLAQISAVDDDQLDESILEFESLWSALPEEYRNALKNDPDFAAHLHDYEQCYALTLGMLFPERAKAFIERTLAQATEASDREVKELRLCQAWIQLATLPQTADLKSMRLTTENTLNTATKQLQQDGNPTPWLDAVLRRMPQVPPAPLDKEDALDAFVLFNTDFIAVDVKKHNLSSGFGLLMMQHFLSETLRRYGEKLPEEVHEGVRTLQKKFECALGFSKKISNWVSTCTTMDQFVQARDTVKEEIVSRLQQGESLYLASGWAGHPGHAIALELIPTRAASGEMTVTGRIQNRGSGVEQHLAVIEGNKLRYDPEILLTQISLDALRTSGFLDTYFELHFTERPSEASDPAASRSLTSFGVNDFYQVLLDEWPGVRESSKNPIARTPQRGPTCSVKPLMTEMQTVLGPHADQFKVYFTKSIWETFLQEVEITDANAGKVADCLKKFARRPLKSPKKPHQKKELPPAEIAAINQLCDTVTEKVEEARRLKRQELAEATIELGPIVESESYSLDLPTSQFGQAQAPPSPPLPSFPRPMAMTPFQIVTTSCADATTAWHAKQSSKAQNILLQAIRELPMPSDAGAWNVTASERARMLTDMMQMQVILFKCLLDPQTERLILSPQQACLWVKLLGITYQLSKEQLPLDVRQYYANGLANLIDSRFPALFCPFNPQDLNAFRDAVSLIRRDVKAGGRAATDEIIKFQPTHRESAVCYNYCESSYHSLEEALENPVLRYLYDFGPPVSGEQIAGLCKIADNYSREADLVTDRFDHRSDISPAFQGLRQAFTFSCLAFNFRGRGWTRNESLGIRYLAKKPERPHEPLLLTTELFLVAPRDEKSYNSGVFADAFPVIPKNKEAEAFVTDLLSGTHVKKDRIFSHQSMLSSFQDSETIKTDNGSVSFSPHELQDLLAAQSTDGLPLVHITQYFQNHLIDLKDPFLQTLLMTSLFKVRSETLKSPIQEALDRLPNSKEINNFFSFLTEALRFTRKTGSWPAYFCLLRVYAVSLSHCLHHPDHGSSKRVLELIEGLRGEIKKMHSEKQLARLEKLTQAGFDSCLLSMIPYLAAQRDSLKPLIATIHEMRGALSFTVGDPAVNEDFHLCEDVATARFLMETQSHLAEPPTKPTTGMFPNWFLENPSYKALFRQKNYPARQISPGLYEFTHPMGICYRIQAQHQDKTLRIFRQFADSENPKAWYEFLEDAKLFKDYAKRPDHPCGADGYLNRVREVWVKVGNSKEAMVMADRKNIICRVFPHQIVHPTSPNLVLLKDYQQPVLDTLAHITAKGQICAWKDVKTNQVSKIELKEFDLTFVPETDKTGQVRWKSTEYYGYYLDTHPKSDAFEPIPDYLVLRNDQGQRKVLVPFNSYRPKSIEFSQSPPPAGTLQDDDILAYDLDEQGRIVLPDDRSSLGYLLYLAVVKEDYALGFQVIAQMKRYPTQRMQFLLDRFFDASPESMKNRNNHPQAVALRLHLLAIYMDGSKSSLRPEQANLIETDYINYLGQLDTLQAEQRLNPKDDKKIKDYLEKNAGGKISLRLYLVIRNDGLLEERTLIPPPDVREVELSTDWKWLDQEMQAKMEAAADNPHPIAFRTRHGAGKQTPFLFNFLAYYRILQSPNPDYKQKDEVLKLLNACRGDTDPRVQCVRTFLLHLHEYRGTHEPYSQLLKGNLVQILTQESQTRSARERSTVSPQTKLAIRPAVRSPLTPTRPEPVTSTQTLFPTLSETLATELQQRAYIREGIPTQADLQKLQKRLVTLREIETEYQEAMEAADNPAVKSECGRILTGTRLSIDKCKKRITDMRPHVQRTEIADVPPEQRTVDFVDDQLDSALQYLHKRSSDQRRELERMEKQICSQLQTYPSEALVLEKHGAMLSPLSIEEALVHFGRGDDAPFYRANPRLTHEQLDRLKKEIGHYLLNKLDRQKTVRVLDKLTLARESKQRYGSTSQEYLVAKEHAVKALRAKRVYEPHQHPHLLVYEVFTDICLRQEQLDALNNLTAGSNDNLVYEARTGFGKSKALIPLWLYLTGRQRTGLAMMTVPSALYEQQISYLKKVMGGAFQLVAYGLQFNREIGNDFESVQRINEKLDEVAAEGGCVVTDINSLHGMIDLKIKEVLTRKPTEYVLLRELGKLRKKVKASSFIDEPQECLNLRNYHDYAIGAPQAVLPQTCQALADIYHILLHLQPPVDFDFLSQEGTEARPSDQYQAEIADRYDKQIKGVLAERLLNDLIMKGRLPTPKQVNKKEFHANLLRHLMGENVVSLHDYLDRLPEQDQRLFAIYREQLSVYLPRTLTKKYYDDYGRPKGEEGSQEVCPWQDGVPKPASEFCSPDDKLNLTLQDRLRTPITPKRMAEFIDTLKARSVTMPKEQFLRDPDYQCYLKLVKDLADWSPKVTRCGESQIAELVKAVNKDLDKKLMFITSYYLPQTKLYPERISSSAHNLVESFERIYGASATVDTDTLPQKFKTIEHPDTPIDTLVAIWQNSQDQIFVVPNQEARALLASTLRDLPQYRAIIDPVSLFRDIRSEKEIATIIFQNTNAKAVSYYDEEGRNLVFIRPEKDTESPGVPIPREQCTLPLEDIFIFMRKSATVGADTPMLVTQKALITIDTTISRERLIQGLGREREIGNGQQAGFLIQKKDAPTFQNKEGGLKLSKILRVSSQNKGEERGQDLFYNLQLALQSQAEKSFMDFFDSREPGYQCIDVFDSLRTFFVENSTRDPIKTLKFSRGTISTELAAEQVKKDFVNRLKPLLIGEAAKIIDLDAITANFDALVKRAKPNLPKSIQMSASEDGVRQVEVVADKTAQAQAQAQEESAQQSHKEVRCDLPKVTVNPIKPTKLKDYTTLGATLRSTVSTEFPEFKQLLDGVYASTNYFHIEKEGRPKNLLNTAYYRLVIRKRNRYRLVLMEQSEAKETLHQMLREKRRLDKDFYLLDATGKVMVQTNPALDLERTEWSKQPRLTLLAKIFARDWVFTGAEVEFVKHLSAEQRQEFFRFTDRIAECWPDAVNPLTELKRAAAR